MACRKAFIWRAGSVLLSVVLLAGLMSACAPYVSLDRTVSNQSVEDTRAVLPAATGSIALEPARTTETALPPTVVPLDACLVGNWMVADLPGSLAKSYSRVESPLALNSVEGETRYVFGADGSLEIRFENLVITLSGTVEEKEIVARNIMVGMATARYRLNPGNREIVFSNFGGDGIQFATEINGQVLAQGNFPSWRAFSSNLTGGSPTIPTAGPTRVVNESFAAITCAGDDMRLQTIDPLPGPEVQLRRIE